MDYEFKLWFMHRKLFKVMDTVFYRNYYRNVLEQGNKNYR